MYWHYGFLWGLPWILFWVFLVFFLFGRHRHFHGYHHEKSAKEILEERFANGEISEEEFEKRMAILKKTR